jgi:fructosamine-3-kinase
VNPLDAVASLTGFAATSAQSISGAVYEVGLGDGSRVVAKRHQESDAVLAEAASLRWLSVVGAPPVPSVRGYGGHWLVIDRVAPGQPSASAAEALGRGLAALHSAGAVAFGSPPPGGPVSAFIGLAPMSNLASSRWPEWYWSYRVEPYLRRAVDEGVLMREEARVISSACARVEDPGEPPARLHGDLWSGNVLWGADGRAWLIDPAAHGGHRETDLAMLRLFGCPHLERVLAAYQETVPLAGGWMERVGLHQLFPLLVHTVLFGRGYAEQAVAAARGVV